MVVVTRIEEKWLERILIDLDASKNTSTLLLIDNCSYFWIPAIQKTSIHQILKRGSNGVCVLWSVAEPSRNKKRKARPAKTEGGKRCVILEDDDLDTGEWLPINALLELTTEQTNVTQTEQNTLKKSRHPIDTSARFLALCLSHAIVLLVCLVGCYCHQMSVSLPAPRHALLTPSQYTNNAPPILWQLLNTHIYAFDTLEPSSLLYSCLLFLAIHCFKWIYR